MRKRGDHKGRPYSGQVALYPGSGVRCCATRRESCYHAGMLTYVIRRILATIPVMAVVALFVFSLLYIAPGDPAAVIAGDQASPADVRAHPGEPWPRPAIPDPLRRVGLADSPW